MNNDNPIRLAMDIQEATKLEAAKASNLPIHICCVLDEYSDFNDPVIHQIRDHCNKNNVLFTTRIYDSSKYNHDRDYIEWLPALHIYIKKIYQKTYYPNTRPIQHINEAIELYKKRIESKKLKKQIWRKRVTTFIEWIKRLLHRKTRMEQYAEDHTVHSKTTDWASRMVIPPN